MAAEELDKRIISGLPPIYTSYRVTPLGESLQHVLDELKDVRMVNEKQINLLMEEFDKQMTEKLDNLPETETFTITQGAIEDHKVVVDYHQIFIKTATIQFPDGAVTSPNIEIMAIRGDQKEPEEPAKRGKRKK